MSYRPGRRGSGGIGGSRHASEFEVFLEAWLVRQEHFLDELLSAQRDYEENPPPCGREAELTELVQRVLAHYREYYTFKLRAMERNVFQFFSPTWFTPLELSYLWITGFNPGLAVRIAERLELTVEQRQQMGRVMAESKSVERRLSEEMAQVQEGMAAPPSLEMARRAGRGGACITGVDAAVEALRAAMESLATRADELRTATVEKVVEILTPAQTVKFLAAATQLQLRIREHGLRNGSERR